MLPVSYLIRNLMRRRVRTIVTISGVAATTLLVVAIAPPTACCAAIGERHDVVLQLVGGGRPRAPSSPATTWTSPRPAPGSSAAACASVGCTSPRPATGLVRGVTEAAYLVHDEVTVTLGEPRGSNR